MDNIKRGNLLTGMSFCFAVFIAGVCAPASASEAPKAFLGSQAILEAWQRNYGSIKSMQVSYTERVLEAEPPATDPNILDNLVKCMHTERTQEGKRYHVRLSYAEDGFAKPENLIEFAFDGMVTIEYWGGQGKKRGTIVSGLTGRGVENIEPFELYMLLNKIKVNKYQVEYPEGMPILNLFNIESNYFRPIVHPYLEPVAEEYCHVLEVNENYKGFNNKYKIWFAHNKGMLPLKYQNYVNDRLTKEIKVEQIAKVETVRGDTWYPVKAHRTVNSKSRGTTIKYELTTHAFVPNVKVDDNTFRFDFPNGTRVVDRVLGIEYVVGVE